MSRIINVKEEEFYAAEKSLLRLESQEYITPAKITEENAQSGNQPLLHSSRITRGSLRRILPTNTEEADCSHTIVQPQRPKKVSHIVKIRHEIVLVITSIPETGGRRIEKIGGLLIV
jgi:hypothetical protein